MKLKKVKMLVCDWYKLGIKPYTVENPKKIRTSIAVHMIEGGEYITEDKRSTNPSSDMYWFQIRKSEYELMKQNLKEVEIEVLDND